MVKFKVRILLPIEAGSTREELQRTLDSIASQTYGIENIEVISILYMHAPEILKWLLEYPIPSHAVYEKKMERQCLIYYNAAVISKQTWNIGIGYTLKLQPGDELYADMIQTCVKLLRKKRVNGILCEAGIRSHEINQKKLYRCGKKMIGRSKKEYLKTGPLHRIFYFERGNTLVRPNNIGQLYYDPHGWNYKFTNGSGANFYYLHREMGVTVGVEKWQDISFTKILAFYHVILQYIRKYEDSKLYRIRQEDAGAIHFNLSCMAMGMSCICGMKGEYDQAEDILLFSKVVDGRSEKMDLFTEIKKGLENKDRDRLRSCLQKIMNGEAGD